MLDRLARRPLAMAAYAVGLARGTVVGVMRVAGTAVGLIGPSHESRQGPGNDGPAQPPDPSARAGERTRFGGLHTEPAPPMTPGGGGEAFEHEPSAESRDVAHGDEPAQPREAASWAEEAEQEDGEEVGPGDAGDEPLIDPATARSVRSEAETMRRAADPGNT